MLGLVGEDKKTEVLLSAHAQKRVLSGGTFELALVTQHLFAGWLLWGSS